MSDLERAKVRTYRIERVVRHDPRLCSFYLRWPGLPEPGQFVAVWLPGLDEKPLSVSDWHDGELELSVKAVGPFTHELMALGTGDWLGLRGPFGRGFSRTPSSLLVAGGIGLAPLRFLSRQLAARTLPHRLLIGLGSRDDLIFPRDYAHAEITTEDGSLGHRGLVTARLEALLADDPPARICAAGPEAMLLAVRSMAERHRIPYELSLERYMKCGIGLCGQCCLEGTGDRLCVEGPVLAGPALERVTDLGLPHRLPSGRRPER